MIDTLTVVQTPEGIALQLRSAGVLPRACAWVLDLLLRGALMTVVGPALVVLGASGWGLYLLALFVLAWFYPVLFEVLGNGQTPGKKIMRLRVLNANGTPVTWLASVVRNLLRVVDMMPFLYGFGVLASLADGHGRRIGDRVAGTLVVYADAPARRAALPEVPALLAPVPLPSGERAAIVEFAERCAKLTPERQEELAALLPMLTQAHGQVAVRRLLGMAAAYLGRA